MSKRKDPPTILEVVAVHDIMDMSVASSYSEKVYADVAQLKSGDRFCTGSLPVGTIFIASVSPQSVSLTVDGEPVSLNLEERWVGSPYLTQTPMISRDEVTPIIRLFRLKPWDFIPDIMDEIILVHRHGGGSVSKSTTEKEQMVLDLIDVDIEAGNAGSWVVKALLAASNDWHTKTIVRQGLFESILLDGIDDGALGPNDKDGWRWLALAAEANDPTNFISDKEKYYDLLASAAENGIYEALDIMDAIWPPEQIIEED